MPGHWGDVKYRQYLEYYVESKKTPVDHPRIFEIFTGVPAEVWREAHDPALYDSIKAALNFISLEPIGKVPATIYRRHKVYTVPKKLLNVKYGKYADLVTIYQSCGEDEYKLMEALPKMCAIFACLDYKTAEELEEIAGEMMEKSTIEIYSLGAFFLSRYARSKTGIQKQRHPVKRILHILQQALIYSIVGLVAIWSFIKQPVASFQNGITSLKALLLRCIHGDKSMLILEDVTKATPK